jgi:FAD/FMN-containing dehydrogenase
LADFNDQLKPQVAAERIEQAGGLLTHLKDKLQQTLGWSLRLMLATNAAACSAARAPVAPQATPTVIYDVTQMNPVTVREVLAPRTTQEIVNAVASHAGPISIGGARHSMGGQTAAPGAMQIDMRNFNRILAFDSVAKTITVQAGIRWRQIQERIDSANLSVKIMQSFANFTVGGSLSVNAHGRYVGFGPLVSSVRSIKIVLADGEVVDASRDVNPELFRGAIGGYGGLGVITEATLDLTENVRVKRRQITMPITQYRQYFFRHVRDSAAVIFHNADIYPDDYRTVRAESYVRTSDPLTVKDRLTQSTQSYRFDRVALWIVSDWPFGQALRQYLVDPWRFRNTEVVWRNYIASSDAAELEPAERNVSTYVLEEYFVPVERFDDFIPLMRGIFRRHRANVLNVSIRHARPDTETLLSWAPREVFTFVVYYKQRTDTASQRVVGVWTRELIDAALRLGGSYYLPYQLHATESEFLRAYPRAPEFFALKRRVDPTNKFENMLWEKYYRP